MTEAVSPSVLEGNLKRYVAFRILFHARFYYPVFTILFLDYGLTLEQFALLNVVWALTIVLAEVPSGALADLVGRKRLLVAASVLMIIEMAVLAFVPLGASPLLVAMFAINRICSGLAEAAASGADEALAYDSLKALGRENEWQDVLERAVRFFSIAMFVAMITGAVSYDHATLNKGLALLGLDLQISHEAAIRLPVFFTLGTAVLCFFVALGFREIPHPGSSAETKRLAFPRSLLEPFRQILIAAKWTFGHRFVLFVIIAALAIDSVARQFVVLGSEYYRIIEIPPALFGFIGAAFSLLGILTAKFARYLTLNHSPLRNFQILSVILVTGLIGITFTLPWIGLLFAIGAFSMMGLVTFLSSFYLNREVDSAHRATVLSFRGLACNLGLAVASLLYTGYIAILRTSAEGADYAPGQLQDIIFERSLISLPIYYIFLFIGILILGKRFIRRSGICHEKPSNP
jgi:MFS family permease